MTAEIIVMNKIGVALAADSAVTLGGAEKIYTSADKLFLLSENSPVGIMIYGNADLIGIPWETIIKLYRKKNNNTTLKKLEDYAESFIEFIKSDSMFTEKYQDAFVETLALSYFYFFREDLLRSRFEEQIAEKKEVNDESIKKTMSEIVSSELEETKKIKLLDGISEDFSKTFREKYITIIQKASKEMFEEIPMEEKAREGLETLICEIAIRQRLGGVESGVVIAGFGEDDIFPSMVEYTIKGVASKQPLYFKSNSGRVEENMAFVAPFAQKEMVHTFMEGIDPELKELITSSTINLFEGAAGTIVSLLESKAFTNSENIADTLKSQFRELANNLIIEWDKKRFLDYSSPIMEIVASLPKDELGAMAEALVNLTKFKRRVSRQQETVGGPIDVAVITKGDGFVWIKRKHYFNQELNPRFTGRYYNK